MAVAAVRGIGLKDPIHMDNHERALVHDSMDNCLAELSDLLFPEEGDSQHRRTKYIMVLDQNPHTIATMLRQHLPKPAKEETWMDRPPLL